MPGLQWTPILAQGERHGWQPDQQRGRPLLLVPGFSIMSLMEPLRQAPQVIPQIILSEYFSLGPYENIQPQTIQFLVG